MILPVEDRGADRAEKLAARGFEQVEIARVIDVVAHGALGVGDPVKVAENRR
jgi:hypothetical protein